MNNQHLVWPPVHCMTLYIYISIKPRQERRMHHCRQHFKAKTRQDCNQGCGGRDKSRQQRVGTSHEDCLVKPFRDEALLELLQLRHDSECRRLQVIDTRLPHWRMPTLRVSVTGVPHFTLHTQAMHFSLLHSASLLTLLKYSPPQADIKAMMKYFDQHGVLL